MTVYVVCVILIVYSANEVVVVVEVVSETVADLLETLVRDHGGRVTWWFLHAKTILHLRLFLVLHDRCGTRILLPPVEWVILLRQFEAKDGEKDEKTDGGNVAKAADRLRSLQLEMHGDGWIGQFVVEVFVDEAGRVRKIVLEIVSVHVVVVQVHTTILMFRLEIEAYVVPVGRPDFIVRVHCVSKIFGDRHG